MICTALVRCILLIGVALAVPLVAAAQERPVDRGAEARAEGRARATVARMRTDEKTILTHGIMPLPFGTKPVEIPAAAIAGAGYVAGIPRLGVPALFETDASLGVAYIGGLRKDGATALPSGVAMAATWNPALLANGGRMIATEARAKGFNVLLAGGVNLTRDPRNGRTFEYLSEDPYLSGMLVGAAVRGIQSAHIISTIKHFALNGQETGRGFMDVKIAEPAARESDLLAFQIGIEQGRPGSVMCAYNRVNGAHACDSDWLLDTVLKRDWGYKGFVMSDWGAVPSLRAASDGLDQQSGAQLDPDIFFARSLAEAAAADPAMARRVDDMNARILTAIYASGLDSDPPRVTKIDFAADAKVAETVAQQAIVLLRNQHGALPLAKTAKRIAVIGGYADAGVLSGAGSSQTQGEGGPAITVPLAGGPWAMFQTEAYHRSSPLEAIRAMAPQADVRFRDGRYISDAVAQAKAADVAIVFATQWASEGFDQPDLSLPRGQDALIEAVAAANPHTIVVLETGGPVLMPWLDRTAAVIEAWYPGARGGQAIAAVLFGDTNPSGRLPLTFPASVDQLPRPALPGFDVLEPDFIGKSNPRNLTVTADYDIEGSDVGYRWFARKGLTPLFPFGYGLSYTSFTSDGLRTDGRTASFTVSNTGSKLGATVAQLYLTTRAGEAKRRLVGFQRVDLAPGERKTVHVAIDRRLLADWTPAGWTIPAGSYAFATGEDAEHLQRPVTVKLAVATFRD